MKEIPLTQGKVAIVDDCDYEWLSQWKWYAQRGSRLGRGGLIGWTATRSGPQDPNGKQEKILMHREIAARMREKFPEVDHWDHDGLNNRRYNLRPCSHIQNMGNLRKIPGTTSRFKGVVWHGRDRRWQASIRINTRRQHLGYYGSETEAAAAYAAAARRHFGEFACMEGAV